MNLYATRPRLLNRHELARAFGTDARDIDRWIADGCPHIRLRQRLVLLYREEVARWLLTARTFAACSLEEVAAVRRALVEWIAGGPADAHHAYTLQCRMEAMSYRLERRAP